MIDENTQSGSVDNDFGFKNIAIVSVVVNGMFEGTLDRIAAEKGDIDGGISCFGKSVVGILEPLAVNFGFELFELFERLNLL